MQREAVNRSVWRSFFGILQVPFFKPKLCKSPTTPFVTSLLPYATTPFNRSPLGLFELLILPCFHPLQRRKAAFPQLPDGTVSAFFIGNTTGGTCSVRYTFLHACFGFPSPVNIWSCVQEEEAKINPKQQSIYQAHLWSDPPVAVSFSVKGKYYLRYLAK